MTNHTTKRWARTAPTEAAHPATTEYLPFPSHVSTQEDAELIERGGDPLEDRKGDFKPDDHHVQHHAGRYALTLNVGLGDNPFRAYGGAARVKFYAEAITNALAHVGLKPQPDTALLLQSFKPEGATLYVGDLWSSRVTEPTDVLHFDVTGPGFSSAIAGAELHRLLSEAVTYLANATGQKAIAARWVDEGARDTATATRGEGLFGTDTKAWGDSFDAAHFEPYWSQRDSFARLFAPIVR